MIDEKLLKKLLKKTDVVTYVWGGCHTDLRSADYLNDQDDRDREFGYIMDDERFTYKKSSGVYLYHEVRCRLKLIAIVYEKGIKVYE